MWYSGVYSCGHDGRVNIIGPTKDRERKAGWHFSGLCPECYKKKQEEKREAANKEAAEKSVEMELPDLSGTEKQVAWANTLRIKVIDDLNSRCDKVEKKLKERGVDTIPDEGIGIKEIADAVQWFIKSHTDARYWIDTRDIDFSLKKVVNEYKKYLEEKANSDVLKEMNDEKESLTVSPECESVKNGIVKIKIKDEYLSSEYVKDYEFMEIVKSLGYKWNGTSWIKRITEYTGTAEDRAAELGNKLLNAGFTVQFPDTESKEKAVSTNFAKENDRWVKFNSETGELTLAWGKRSDTLYDAAKKLPGAKWNNRSMKVNIEFYREVLDFAETMGFSISKTAQEKISEYQSKESRFETVKAKTPNTEWISDEERIKKSLKTDGTIIEDLIDEESI